MDLQFKIDQTASSRFFVYITDTEGKVHKYQANTLWNCFKKIYVFVRDNLKEVKVE